MKYYLEFKDTLSNKFWYITQQDESLTIVFGKIGAKGQTQVKTFSSPADAEKEANKLIKSKIKKGYEEKAIPPTLEQSTCTEKTIIKMADAPKPKYHPKPIPPKDVIDDGEKKPWRDLVAFDFEELRKVPPKEVVPVKQPPKQSNTSIKKETLTKTPQEQEFDNLKILLRSYIKQGVQFDIEATFEQLKALSPSNNEFQIFIKDMLQMIFSKFMKKISPIHFDCIPYLLRIRDPEILFQEIFAQGVMKYIYDRYQTHSESIHQLAEQYLTDYPVQMVDKIVNGLQYIFDTTQTEDEKNTPTDKLPENVCGFYITFDYKKLEIYALFNERSYQCYYSENLNELEYDGTSYGVEINNQYFVPLLTEKLQKMLDDGFFGDMTNKYFKIALFQTDNILIEIPLEQTYRQTKVFELESDLKYLEKSDEYYADLLTDTVDEYFALNGVIEQYDTDRILALLKKYLYSGEKEAESEGCSLLNRYSYFDYEWRLVYLQFQWENFNYKYAYSGVECLAERYEPAILQKQAWDKLGIIDSKSEKKDDSRYQSATERFYNTFTENDVFCETDTIIARAMPTGGEIYLRFKQESEQAYSDALDYLNGIMAKGYSVIFQGHWLHIYFVAKPKYYSEFAKYVEDFEYLKDIEESELGLAIGGIVCGSHAFFRKAVMYESLHDKIRAFVDLTMYQDHKSFEIQDESSVAGTFAAIALAMTDVKHMDLAIKFANEIDSYYEDLASNFGIVLEKYWGITPETAVAIALLQLSYECHTAKLSSQFYKIPQNLASLTDYYRRNEPKNPNCKLTNLVIELFDNYKPSYALKKLKKLFNNATDPQEKLIYADFHNLVIEALEEEGEVSGQPIIYNLPPKYENDSKPLTIVDQNFIENPPCVITPLQAKKRGFNVRELETYDSSWRAVIFAPLTITNPYIFDAIIQYCKVQNDIGTRSVILWGAEQAYCFGKKVVIDFSGTPYQVGMGIYGTNQAQLIYGVMDFAKIAEAMNKQAPDKEKLFALRKQYYYFDSPKGSPVIDESKPGMMYLDEALRAGVFEDDNYRAIKQLEKITPDMGEVYDASLLIMAYMQQKKLDYAMEILQRIDTTELKQVYQTAQKRLPQYQEYWQEKLAKL
ncbi:MULTISPECIES: WGR domain-containing protein [unclassified Gilliamella]|uniref:WGR domain-containing protein n=1 Tax=unclassified Gilliamella TaxID=2685620 RepID=UPI00226A82D5|nr:MULTISPECIES: WGR domain-containing protein [unclassified Gilliamella]MCX8584997.1 WGR domain-containing protein [Gilliamella sp. B3562]MCX8684644.1 WGR domain-containing protein [Gilliamella sp. B2864]